jgi:predicted dehydrogenase
VKAVVVGFGSIGSRHARILDELGCRTAVVSSRHVKVETLYTTINAAVQQLDPEYVVIASETSQHLDDLTALIASGFRGNVLVEKPLFHNFPVALPQLSCTVFVAYNLRFHPLLQRLRKLLQSETIISVQAYVGQYLPLWRPGRDYRTVYSASKYSGGGVLRDLSHELDLLNWLLGGWQKLTALGGHFSGLEINCEDIFSILMTTERCPVVTMQMNYLDRVGRRQIIVNTEERTFEADFVAGHLLINGKREEFTVERDHSYREMHTALLESRLQDVCTFAEGLDVVGMIATAEQAVEEERWIKK